MDESPPRGGWTRRHTIALVIALTIVLVGAPFAAGVIDGYSGRERVPGEVSPAILIVAIGILLVAAGTAWAVWRPRFTAGLSDGEARLAAKARTFWTILGALFLAGFFVGIFGAAFERETDGGWMTGTLPPWFAILTAIVLAVAMLGGSWIFYRRIDEYERRDNYVASAVAANAVLVGYPVWFVLWSGGWVDEPSHQAVFVSLFLVTCGTYLFRKIRA